MPRSSFKVDKGQNLSFELKYMNQILVLCFNPTYILVLDKCDCIYLFLLFFFYRLCTNIWCLHVSLLILPSTISSNSRQGLKSCISLRACCTRQPYGLVEKKGFHIPIGASTFLGIFRMYFKDAELNTHRFWFACYLFFVATANWFKSRPCAVHNMTLHPLQRQAWWCWDKIRDVYHLYSIGDNENLPG